MAQARYSHFQALKFSGWTVSQAQFFCFALGILLYALFSSPTPDDPGWIEGLIAVLLCAGIGVGSLYESLTLRMRPMFWQAAGWVILLYGVCVLLPLGIMMGHEPLSILRDLPPLVFLLLPLFAVPLALRDPVFLPRLMAVYVIAGLVFSVRGIFEADPFRAYAGITGDERYYFANAPSVLFAAVFPVGWALGRYVDTLRVRDARLLLLCCALALVPLLAMVVSAQRASLACAVMIYAVLALVAFYKRPGRIWPLLVLVMIGLVIVMAPLQEIAQALIHKTNVHGINKRGLEFAAVWEAINGHSGSALFGLGWGATYHSPAVGGTRVNFTHNFTSGMLLKGGVTLAVISAVYILSLAAGLWIVMRHHLVLGLALFGPFVINVFLYASYKWLDFGLLLLILAAAVASPAGVLYARRSYV